MNQTKDVHTPAKHRAPISDKLAGIGLFGGLLMAAGSANDAALDMLGMPGWLGWCFAWIAVSAVCAGRLGVLDFGKEEEAE